jgi:hypothetical protein
MLRMPKLFPSSKALRSRQISPPCQHLCQRNPNSERQQMVEIKPVILKVFPDNVAFLNQFVYASCIKSRETIPSQSLSTISAIMHSVQSFAQHTRIQSTPTSRSIGLLIWSEPHQVLLVSSTRLPCFQAWCTARALFIALMISLTSPQ